jgi:hypothetical protein
MQIDATVELTLLCIKLHHESPWVKRCLSQKSESTLLVEGFIPSVLVSQTQGGHDEYLNVGPKLAKVRFEMEAVLAGARSTLPFAMPNREPAFYRSALSPRIFFIS